MHVGRFLWQGRKPLALQCILNQSLASVIKKLESVSELCGSVNIVRSIPTICPHWALEARF